MKPFARFADLFLLHNKTIKLTKKWSDDLEKEAIAWFEANFPAEFDKYDMERPYKWYYSAGMLTFKTPIGSYIYHFIIKMIHFEMWLIPAWIDGFNHPGKQKANGREISRDDNPYPIENFYFHSAWDAGYMQGLDRFCFFKKGKIKS